MAANFLICIQFSHKKAVSFVIIVMMKKFYLFLLLFAPLMSLSQDLTGVWVGYIHNDTTNMNLYYEVVITQAKGKLKGYSYTTFVVDGRELTGVKTVEVTKQGDKVYIEDDDLIFHDYPFAPPKGVKQLSVYEQKAADVLEGKFMTSRTKQYGKQVTGTIYLQRVRDFEAAKIYPLMKRMDLLAGLSFIQQKEDVAKAELSKPVVAERQRVETMIEAPEPKVETTSPVATTDKQTKTKPVAEKPNPATPVPTGSTVAASKSNPDIKKELEKRKVETIETVYFSSDSLILEVYDNGYVDGDSVSVLVNGKEFISHVKLTSTAVRKTIYITPDMGDSLKLILFAENLGTIAPNSGMAVIYEGKKQYKIAFSGDLEKNAAIILRRRK
jgi:hypothetical protein